MKFIQLSANAKCKKLSKYAFCMHLVEYDVSN